MQAPAHMPINPAPHCPGCMPPITAAANHSRPPPRPIAGAHRPLSRPQQALARPLGHARPAETQLPRQDAPAARTPCHSLSLLVTPCHSSSHLVTPPCCAPRSPTGAPGTQSTAVAPHHAQPLLAARCAAAAAAHPPARRRRRGSPPCPTLPPLLPLPRRAYRGGARWSHTPRPYLAQPAPNNPCAARPTEAGPRPLQVPAPPPPSQATSIG